MAEKVAEIDEITIYGMLSASGLVRKRIDALSYKSAGAYLPLQTLYRKKQSQNEHGLTKVINKYRKIIEIADRQCAV